ncbi:MAG: penicillin-binding protein 1C [Patescibacteria group bacterium]
MKLRVPKRLRPVTKWMKQHKRLLLFTMIGGAFFLFVTLPIITYIAFASQIETKEQIVTLKDGGVVLLDRKDEPFFTLYDAKNREVVPLEQISEYVQHAVIASEDQEFYNHPGFSISGILRSAKANLASGEISQGGSTITQQLVKNVLLSSERTFWRKYQEVILAIELDRRFSKEEILEMYLNTVYFGEGAFGVQTAAKTYYGKDAKNLTISESAMLAGVLPAPSALSPISGNKEAAIKRQRRVLKLMLEEGYITNEEHDDAVEETLDFSEGDANVNVMAPHFALMIQDELAEEYDEQELAQSGFFVKTTLDTDLQQHAQEAVAKQVDALSGQDVGNGAAVVMDPQTGDILALVGSHSWADEENGKINMAVAPRQPGSSFKPLVYATGVEEELVTAGTILKDEETDFGGGYKPKNYDSTFRGDVSLRRSLAISLNIPAVEVMQKVGIQKMLNKSRTVGITTLDRSQDYGLSLVLGSGAVPLIEMTNAYAAFANEGVLPERRMILEIQDKNRKSIFKAPKTQTKRVWKEEVAFIISDILSDAAARSEVFSNSLTISQKAAVKTGTTDDNRDALTIGYTPDIVVGAWVGNNDNSPMAGVAGSFGAGPIWKNIMNYAVASNDAEWYKKPDTVEEVLICKEKGLRIPEDKKDEYTDGKEVGEGEDKQTITAVVEYYIRGTEPDSEELCIDQSPTPDPTKEAERKKKEEEKKKLSATPKPKPTDTPSPTVKPTEKPKPTKTPIPTDVPEEDSSEEPETEPKEEDTTEGGSESTNDGESPETSIETDSLEPL